MIRADQEAIGQNIASDQKRLGDARHFKQAKLDITDDIAQDQFRSDYRRTHRCAVGVGGNLSEGGHRHRQSPSDLALSDFGGWIRGTVDREREGNAAHAFVFFVIRGTGVAIAVAFGLLDGQIADEKAALRRCAKDHGGQGRNAPIGQIDRLIRIKNCSIAQASIPTGCLGGRGRFVRGCKQNQGFVQCRVHTPMTVQQAACDRLFVRFHAGISC